MNPGSSPMLTSPGVPASRLMSRLRRSTSEIESRPTALVRNLITLGPACASLESNGSTVNPYFTKAGVPRCPYRGNVGAAHVQIDRPVTAGGGFGGRRGVRVPAPSTSWPPTTGNPVNGRHRRSRRKPQVGVQVPPTTRSPEHIPARAQSAPSYADVGRVTLLWRTTATGRTQRRGTEPPFAPIGDPCQVVDNRRSFRKGTMPRSCSTRTPPRPTPAPGRLVPFHPVPARPDRQEGRTTGAEGSDILGPSHAVNDC